ncbi:Apoptosis inhibitor 5 [Linnemannia zychae]|nr:Apoptosis inhibitor 5 [Linnemannia zychae]
MTDIETIYNAYNEITDAGDNAPQVRQTAIKSLPSLCKDGPQHTIKIADVLCQLLQLDDEDLVIVQEALQTLLVQSPREVLAVLFTQGLNGIELREKTITFIANQISTSFVTGLVTDPDIERFFVGELLKAMKNLSDSELETFAKIIMQTTLYKTEKLDLAELAQIYVAHIISQVPWNINSPDSIKRVLVAGKLSMPLFQRNISADPLLTFFAANILPCDEFKKLTEVQKAHVMRLYTDSITSGHPSPAVLKQAGRLVSTLLMLSVPAERDSTIPIELAPVECFIIILDLFTKDPNMLKEEELVARFRTLYNTTQYQLSSVKQELKDVSAKLPHNAEQTAKIRSLTKKQTEFLKPKTLWTKHVVHPSWKPVPELTRPGDLMTVTAVKPVSTNPSIAVRPVAKPTTRSTVKLSTQSITKPGVKPTLQLPPKPQPHQSQGASNKRKADLETNTNQKKPKISRPQNSNVPDSSVNKNFSGQNPSQNQGVNLGEDQSQNQDQNRSPRDGKLSIQEQVQAQMQLRAQAQAQAQAQVQAQAQAQVQAQTQAQAQQRQQHQPSRPRGQLLPRGPSKSSTRHGLYRNDKKSGYGFGNGSDRTGGLKTRGFMSPSTTARNVRRRESRGDRINFLQSR